MLWPPERPKVIEIEKFLLCAHASVFEGPILKTSAFFFLNIRMVPILLCYNETLRFIELFDSGNGESHLLEIIDDWLPAIFITDGDHSDTTRATIEQKQREQKH